MSPTPTHPAEEIPVRPITADELSDWSRTLNTGFVRPPAPSPEVVAKRRAYFDLSRTRAAFAPAAPEADGAGTKQVATFRSFAQELTVPGGATVPTDAVTNVTVSPTHRRRGLLSRMMAADLTEAKERGDVAATLIAAEYPIYGRFGFGCATTATTWEIDVPRAGLDTRWSGPEGGGRVDFADAAEVRKVGPELHEKLRGRTAGFVSRGEQWWQHSTGLWPTPEDPWTEPFHAVYRNARGEVEGLAVYTVEPRFNDNVQPACTAKVADLFGLTPAAERALWHFVCSVDWVTVVESGHRAPDDLLPDLLPDPRAARVVRQADSLWVRILDVVRALEARSYDTSGEVVLEVTDAAGFADGRFKLTAAPGGAVCAPSAASPHLTVDVRELGVLWLGDVSAVRLAALGRLFEHEPGAAAAFGTLMGTARRPWCPDLF
ncbi:GNAT family N-acetyltransferase [Streptomyces sp. WG-D5]